MRRTIMISFGTALEYYDFAIFGMMANYLADVFFSSTNINSSVVLVYFMFSLAYFARPIGGLVFGLIGDHFGRRASLLLVTLIMALSTFSIGLLPTNSALGIYSGVFLALLRLLQGFSYGAELPGVLITVAEQSGMKKIALRCSIVMSITGLGAVIGTLVLYIMSLTLDHAAIVAWGWRIPFILGGMLALLSYYMRSQLVQPLKHQVSNKSIFSPLRHLLRYDSCKLLFGLLLVSFFSCLVLMEMYFITYYPQHYFYKLQDMYFARMISRTLSSICLVLFGLLVERIGSIRLLIYTLLLFLIFIMVYVILDPLRSSEITHLITFLCIYEILLVAYIAALIPFVINFFDANVRFTGLAICYNFSFALAGLIPKTFGYMIEDSDEPLVIFMMPVALACLVLMSIIWTKFKHDAFEKINYAAPKNS
jgi:MFS family permease